MIPLETSKQFVGVKLKMPCKSERNRMTSSWGVVFVIIGIIAFTWSNIYDSNRTIKTKELEQTAIAKVFNESGTSMIVLGENSKILYWDENSVKLFGYTTDEVYNKSVDLIVPSSNSHIDTINKTIKEDDRGAKIVTCNAKRKDGKVIKIAIRVYAPFKKDQILVLADELKPNTLTER